eukprot:jgi/Botrbrau1/19852/Bobra.0124s0088.1
MDGDRCTLGSGEVSGVMAVRMDWDRCTLGFREVSGVTHVMSMTSGTATCCCCGGGSMGPAGICRGLGILILVSCLGYDGFGSACVCWIKYGRRGHSMGFLVWCC